MIFSEPQPYRCSNCHKWWMPGGLACAVEHHAVGCCHYGETECEPPAPIDSGPVSPATRELVARATSGGIRNKDLRVEFDDED